MTPFRGPRAHLPWNPRDARKAREAGIDAYLTKPVRQSHLLDAIATVMGSTEAEEGEAHLVTQHSIGDERARERARILLAEDNAINQKVAVKLLESLGYRRVDVAANGIGHTLKGSSGNMGAKRMSRLCLDLEHACGSNDIPAAARLLEGLKEEFDHFRTELSTLVG